MAQGSYKAVLDFLVNIKGDKSQVEKFANETAATLEKINPEIKINSEELKTQISGLADALDIIEQSGMSLNDVLSNMNIDIDTESALSGIENLSSAAGDLENGLQNVNLDELSNSLNMDDFSLMTDAFSQIDTTEFVSAMQEAGVSLNELSQQAESVATSGRAALESMASEGKTGTAEYQQLETELSKTEQMLSSLKSLSNINFTATGGSGEVKVTPQIDDSKIHGDAKKIGETAGKDIGEGMKHGIGGLDLHEIFGGILSVFGGQALMGGVSGVVGGFEGLLEAGKKSMEMSEQLELGFKQAGLAGEELDTQLSATSKFATRLSDDFAVSAGKIKEYSQQAAFLGGATGKANEDLTTLAVVIEKASNGMVSGNQVIRTFSRGLGDPEAVANLGRLKMAFPQLATALKDVENPAEMTQKALESLSPTIATLKEQAEGPIGSMEKLQNKLNSIKTQLGRSFVEALSPVLITFGETLVPVFQSVATGLGNVTKFISEHSEVFKELGIAATAVTGSMFLLGGGFTNLIGSASGAAMNILEKLVPALVTQTASTTASVAAIEGETLATVASGVAKEGEAIATEGAAVAQRSLNLAILANPYVLAAAAIAGIVIGLHALTGALNETAEEKLKDADAQDVLINKQIEAKEKEIELAESKQNLVEEFKNSGEAAIENTDLMVKLAQSYPGVIDASKSYEENLASLSAVTAQTGTDLGVLSSQLDDLAQKKIDVQVQIANLKTDVEAENIENDMTDTLSKLDWGKVAEGAGVGAAAGAAFGGPVGAAVGGSIGAAFGAFGDKIEEFLVHDSSARENAKSITEPYISAIKNASNSQELEKASLNFQMAMFNSGNFDKLTAEEKTKMLESINKMVEARKSAMDNANQNAGKDFDILKESGMETGQIVDFLAQKYHTTKEEIQGIIDKQKEETGAVKETQAAVEQLANAFESGLKNAKKGQTDAVNALAEAYVEYQQALKSGDTDKIRDAETKLADTRKESKTQYKEASREVLDANNALKKSQSELGVQEQKTSKSSKEAKNSEYETASKLFDKYKQESKQRYDDFELEQKFSILTQDRQKNEYDDLTLQQRQTEETSKKIVKFQELYKSLITINETGGIDFNPKVNLKDDQKEKIKNDWMQLNYELKQDQLKDLELKAKIKLDDVEFSKKLADFKRQQLEYDISIGIKKPGDLLSLLKIELNDIDAELKGKQADLDVFINVLPQSDQNKAQVEQLNKDILDLENKRFTKSKELTSKEKEIYDSEINAIKKTEEEATKAVEESYKKQTDTINKFNEVWSTTESGLWDKEKTDSGARLDNEQKAKLDNLQKWQDAEVISKDEFERRKTEIEAQSAADRQKFEEDEQKKKTILDQLAKGAQIHSENEHSLKLAEIQKKSLEGQLQILSQKKDTTGLTDAEEEQFLSLFNQLDVANQTITEKGTAINEALGILGQQSSEALTNLFAGDSEKAGDNMKVFFLQMTGIMEKGLIKLIDETILEWLLKVIGVTSTDPLSLLFVAPVLYATISGAVHAIADPLLKPLSFASGGRIDEPTVAILGDAAKLGSNNREWVFNDSQLITTVQMASSGSNAMLIDKLDRVEKLLASQELTTTLKGSDIDIALRRTAFNNFSRRK